MNTSDDLGDSGELRYVPRPMTIRPLTYLRPVLLIACIASLPACGGDDGGSGTANMTSDSDSSASDSTEGASTGANATDADATSSTTGSDETGSTSATDGSSSTSEDMTTSTTSPTTTEDPTATSSGGETGVAPSGLEAFCSHYVDCGGTYYEDEEACINASLDYWGDCPSRREALDAFGECMTGIPCDEWNPDTYNPASTDCAEEWQALGQSEPC